MENRRAFKKMRGDFRSIPAFQDAAILSGSRWGVSYGACFY